MNILKRYLAVTFLVSSLSSCSSAYRPEPEVSVVNLQLGDVSLFETNLLVDLRIENEAPEPLVLEGAVYKLYLNDTYVGKGMSNETVKVPGLSSATHSVQVPLSNLAIAADVRSLLEAPALSYTVDSTLYLDNSYGFSSRIQSKKGGEISFQGIQQKEPN